MNEPRTHTPICQWPMWRTKKTEQNNELINFKVYDTDKVYYICRCWGWNLWRSARQNLYQRRSNRLYHEFTDSKKSVEIHSDLNVKWQGEISNFLNNSWAKNSFKAKVELTVYKKTLNMQRKTFYISCYPCSSPLNSCK